MPPAPPQLLNCSQRRAAMQRTFPKADISGGMHGAIQSGHSLHAHRRSELRDGAVFRCTHTNDCYRRSNIWKMVLKSPSNQDWPDTSGTHPKFKAAATTLSTSSPAAMVIGNPDTSRILLFNEICSFPTTACKSNIPPAEAEANYYAQRDALDMVA